MAEESRVKKSLLNARVNLIFYFLTLILSFFSRKIFLDCLGADFVGLTTTLQNLLGFSITLSMEFYMIYFTMKVTAILLFSITMTDRLQISNLIVVR